MTDPAPGIHWLTRDFRFSDNEAMVAAIGDGPLLCVFFRDRLLSSLGSATRWRTERALQAFDAELRQRGNGQGLVLLDGEPDEILPGLMARTGARRVHQSDWPEPRMRALQDRVRKALSREGRSLDLHGGHLLQHPNRVRTQEGGVYRVFTPFARALRTVGPESPGPVVPQRFDMAPPPRDAVPLAEVNLAPDLHRGRSALEDFALPAGEAAALDRLDDFLDRVDGYAENRDRPDLGATSELSEYLAMGEIGPRTVWSIASLRARSHPERERAISKFLSELAWREFAWHLLIDFPDMPSVEWRRDWTEFPWRGRSDAFASWKRAETGVGLVDAGLREMWVTGRMHNRVRMVVASWLTKHLLTDWRLGLDHFADCLTDWDPAANAMNWQWVAGCGPDAAPYFRVFNPETQAGRFDPDGRYRRRWLAGWMGEPGPAALAYLDSTPKHWQVKAEWLSSVTSDMLTSGRQRALQAYEEFRRQ